MSLCSVFGFILLGIVKVITFLTVIFVWLGKELPLDISSIRKYFEKTSGATDHQLSASFIFLLPLSTCVLKHGGLLDVGSRSQVSKSGPQARVCDYIRPPKAIQNHD